MMKVVYLVALVTVTRTLNDKTQLLEDKQTLRKLFLLVLPPRPTKFLDLGAN